MDLIPLGIGFGSGGITIGFLAKWIFVTKGELVAHEKEDRLRSDASVQRVDDKLADTTDTQFTPTKDGSQLDNIVYQLTGLGTRLGRANRNRHPNDVRNVDRHPPAACRADEGSH